MKPHENKFTVTIGISAYNEEANIGKLIKKILEQNQNNYLLKEILIVSDCSTDKTNEIIESFQSPLITLIKQKQRSGQQVCQNLILRLYNSDILVFIEADTLPYNRVTIDELIKPFLNNNDLSLGMVVGHAINVAPVTFFEKIMLHGGNIKDKLFNEWKNGQNIYSTGGHAMKALSREFTKKLHWPDDVPEDSYTYLKLKTLNLNMIKQKKAKSYMKDVTHLADGVAQYYKFTSGKESLKKYFISEFVESEYNAPLSLLLKHILIETVKNPIWSTLYFCMLIIKKILTINKKRFNPLYDPYLSTKNLRTGEK